MCGTKLDGSNCETDLTKGIEPRLESPRAPASSDPPSANFGTWLCFPPPTPLSFAGLVGFAGLEEPGSAFEDDILFHCRISSNANRFYLSIYDNLAYYANVNPLCQF